MDRKGWLLVVGGVGRLLKGCVGALIDGLVGKGRHGLLLVKVRRDQLLSFMDGGVDVLGRDHGRSVI